ncbi:MAG: 16S rRNA (guanine(527)-N(7))-methyltransferase RsmG [Candidatus Lambdaproteobacteria bacterium]|nr:16S rRNA (guanine(527)-N(7))-methyltransferase RsmG [Candidatus Lambdaproteobacteria bacterium]
MALGDFVRIEPALAQAGIVLDDDARTRLLRLVELLARWNRRINLTGHRSREELIVRHVLDCLMLETLPWPAGSPEAVDLGSGAGLPGLIVALRHPGSRVVSLETVAKKATFQQVAAAELGLANFVPLRVDAHRFARSLEGRGRFDLVFARAFAALAVLLELAALLLRPGGRLRAMKGPALAAEQAAVPAALRAAFEPEPRLYPYRFDALNLGGVIVEYVRREA